MVEFINEKVVKVRKNHECHGCLKIILNKSNRILRQTFKDDDIYNLYYCSDCQEYLENKCQKCNECFELENVFPGFIKECKLEER